MLLDIYDGNYQNAIDFLNKVNFESVQPQFYFHPKSMLFATVYDFIQDVEKAKHYYNLARDVLSQLTGQVRPTQAHMRWLAT